MAWKKVVQRARLCEEEGYYSIAADDHLFRGKGGNILEGWTTISAVASVTERIRLTHFVICNSFRNPALLAKMLSTLDNITGGRVEVGIGAGWMEDEYVQYGVAYESHRVRIERLKEGVEILRRMFTVPRATYEGKYYRIQDAVCEPKPVQHPHPPIWVGGGGERFLLRVVAEVADGWNHAGSPALMAQKAAVLRRHCEAVGRDYDRIKKSVSVGIAVARAEDDALKKAKLVKPDSVTMEEYLGASLVGTPDGCIRKVQDYLDLGIDYLIVTGYSQPSDDELRLFAREVMGSF